MAPEQPTYVRRVPESASGQRLDRFLADWLGPEGISRSRIQGLIKGAHITLDGKGVRAATRLKGGETLAVTIPPVVPSPLHAKNIPLAILYQDEAIVVIDKAPGLVVHPAPGHRGDTLVHALLYHIDGLSAINGEERPGIVHRLDKDTSGVLVIARSDRAHRALSAQFQVHSIVREYRALVRGCPRPLEGEWSSMIGRNPKNRLKMASVRKGGRRALTRYRVLETFSGASLIECSLETGRTHQIRVHASEAGHPVLGDATYGRHWRRGLPDDAAIQDALAQSGRQLLHARRLGFIHPTDHTPLDFIAEPPDDFTRVLEAFRNHRAAHRI